MAQYGWVLFIERPELTKENAREYLTIIRPIIENRLKRVESLLTGGLRLASKQSLLGSACIVGPEEECLRLKEQVESMGIARMIPNEACIRGA